jgi:glutamate 5-kinase
VRRPLESGSRLVVKVGSSSLVGKGGGLDPAAIERTTGLVAAAWERGHPTALVTSGAVAAGLPSMGLSARPADLPGLQVAAAVGQGRLMERYTLSFNKLGLVAGQVLLTREVLANREQYLNARAALDRMLGLGIVPVINENDTVGGLGDNDRLAAVVSHLTRAGLLLILTDTDGLFSADPRLGEGELLPAVRHTDQILDRLSGTGTFGSGGAATKVTAARMAAWSGVPTVVAAASANDVLERVVAGDEVGTWVDPRPETLTARKLWIAFGQAAIGSLVIDDGAVRALVDRSTSLLPVGVTEVRGNFPVGSGVEVLDQGGRLVAKGLVRLGSADLRARVGRRSDIEAIHRDDLVVLEVNPTARARPRPTATED